MELKQLEGGVGVEADGPDDPVADPLDLFGVTGVADPHLDGQHVLADLVPEPVDPFLSLQAKHHEGQQDVFPDFVGVGLLEAQEEGAAVLVVDVLPDGLDLFLEGVEVDVVLEVTGPLEVLVQVPEGGDGSGDADGQQTLVEVLLGWLVLVPELDGSLQLQCFLIHSD